MEGKGKGKGKDEDEDKDEDTARDRSSGREGSLHGSRLLTLMPVSTTWWEMRSNVMSIAPLASAATTPAQVGAALSLLSAVA